MSAKEWNNNPRTSKYDSEVSQPRNLRNRKENGKSAEHFNQNRNCCSQSRHAVKNLSHTWAPYMVIKGLGQDIYPGKTPISCRVSIHKASDINEKAPLAANRENKLHRKGEQQKKISSWLIAKISSERKQKLSPLPVGVICFTFWPLVALFHLRTLLYIWFVSANKDVLFGMHVN